MIEASAGGLDSQGGSVTTRRGGSPLTPGINKPNTNRSTYGSSRCAAKQSVCDVFDQHLVASLDSLNVPDHGGGQATKWENFRQDSFAVHAHDLAAVPFISSLLDGLATGG